MSENEKRLVSTLTRPSAVPSGPSDTGASASSTSSPQIAKPGRRRRAAESKNKSSKTQHFYFVDQNSSSKEKRAHVMRHHVQEKRKQRKMSGTLSTKQIPDHTSYSPKKEAGNVETRFESPPTAVQNFPQGETAVWESLFSSQASRPQPSLDYLGIGSAANDDGSRC
jgi:hypothetical protein